MANDFPVQGDKLKKLIKKSRQMPIPFGFNPGTSDDDDEYLAAHARKAPEVLGKMALNEGAGTKSSFGTFAVDGSEVHLTCFRTIPQLAKKFKKYLKRFKITLNCLVMDPDGNIIDSDVETLDEWFQEVDDRQDEAAEAAEAAAEEADEAEADDSGIDPADLATRLRALQPKVTAAPPNLLDRVAAGFKGAVGLIKEGKLEKASIAIAQLEAVMARLAALPKTAPPQAAAAPQPTPSTLPQAQAAPDPRLPRLREAVAKLSEQVGALLGKGAGPLLDQLSKIDGLIDAGEAEAALGALRSAQDATRAAQAAREKWDKAQAILEPQVTKALSDRSVADPDTLRSRWQVAVTLATEGGWARALAAVPGIAEKLREPATETPQAGAPPQGVVAFQQSRVLWSGTRTKMLAEARKLADAIVAQSSDDPDAAEIAKASEEIVAQIEMVDTRLQDILEKITDTEEGRQRAALKSQAAAVITEYRDLLASGIFPVIDDNPFAPVAVASSARMALDQIARTLA